MSTEAAALPGSTQSRPATVSYNSKRAGVVHQIEGSVHLNIKDFSIEISSYMGVTVEPDIDAIVRGKLDDA